MLSVREEDARRGRSRREVVVRMFVNCEV